MFDLLDSQIEIKEVYVRENWSGIQDLPKHITCTITTEQYLKKITQLKTAPPVIAVCQQPQTKPDFRNCKVLTIALDEIQDPGNLGTIIRLADWFGIENIVCSKDTADAYNPKVVQATMGAIARVNVFYVELENYLNEQQNLNIPIYGTFLDGQNIYNQELSNYGIIIMGNEGKGISKNIEQLIDKKLLIPSFSNNPDKSESLNVSTATGIILSEFKRRG